MKKEQKMKLSTFGNRKAQHFCKKHGIHREELRELYNAYGKQYFYRKCGEEVSTQGLEPKVLAELLFLTNNYEYRGISLLKLKIEKKEKKSKELKEKIKEIKKISFKKLLKQEIKKIKKNKKARKYHYEYRNYKCETFYEAKKFAEYEVKEKTEDNNCLNKKERKFINMYEYLQSNLPQLREELAIRELALTVAPEIRKIIKNAKPTKPAKKITEEDRIAAWARRLDRLTGCGIDVATDIANEKIEYKQECIERVESRESLTDAATNRQIKLIAKMERENPLRRIKDTEHAEAILSASNRHNKSDYEDKLEEGKELKAEGEIEDAREYAKNNYQY